MKKHCLFLAFALATLPAFAQSYPDITDNPGVSVTIGVPTYINSGVPLAQAGTRWTGTSHSVPAGLDFVYGVGSDNLLHCFLSSTLGSGSCLSSSLSINGTGVSNPNFGNVPAAQTGFLNANLQVSGSNVSIEVPTSGNGPSLVTTTGLGTTAGVTPCTDANGNITTTCSNPATGLGVYMMTEADQATGCMQVLASEDGRQVRPITWPLDPLTRYSYCGPGTPPSTSSMFGSLFFAPWNLTYYLIFSDNGNLSGYTQGPPIGVASSPDLTTWTFLQDITTAPHGSSATSIFYDSPAQCPAQNYSCLHVIAPYNYQSSGGAMEVAEFHPTNAALTTWSGPTQLAGSVLPAGQAYWSNFMMNYGGTYYLFTLTTTVPSAYSVYTASSLYGTYTYQGLAPTAWCPTGSGTNCVSNGTEMLNIIWTGSAWRAYVHPAQTLLGTFYIENATSPVASTGWGAQVPVAGQIDQGGQQLTIMRTADPKTLSIIGASARQSVLPLYQPRGIGNCDNNSTTFNVPGLGGVYQGMCFGIEHSDSVHNGEGYNALRLFASNSIAGFVTWSHIDFGNYTTSTAFTNWLQMQPNLAQFAGGIQSNPGTVSTLAAMIAAGAGDGTIVNISDGTSPGDPCAGSGGGSVKATCRYNAATTAWEQVHSGMRPWAQEVTWNGIVPSSTYLLIYAVPTYSPAVNISIPTNCAGSTFKVYTATTSASTFTVAKNGTTICTATVAAGTTTVSWGSIGGTNTLTSSDVLTVIGGGDATLANFGLAIMGSY